MNIKAAILLILISAITAVQADTAKEVFNIQVETTFSNENWFPLSEKDMREAAVDTALDLLSSQNLFTSDKSREFDGKAIFKVALVEPAEVAKLTITLNLKDNASYVATASTSLHDMYYPEIYRAFEHIGQAAAERMNAKIIALRKQVKPTSQNQISTTETPKPNIAISQEAKQTNQTPLSTARPIVQAKKTDNHKPVCQEHRQIRKMLSELSVKNAYDYAQNMKDRECYFNALIIFEYISEKNTLDNDKYKKLSIQELIYGLPVFEARKITVDMSTKIQNFTPEQLSSKLSRIDNLYRQILSEEQSYENTLTAQREFDDFKVRKDAIYVAIRTNERLKVQSILYNINGLNISGQLPMSAKVFSEKYIGESSEYKLISYKKDNVQRTYNIVLSNSTWGFTYKISGGDYVSPTLIEE